MTEPFKFVVSNDPAKARQAIGTLGVPADYDVSGSGDYMVNDVVRYTDPAPSPTTDFTGLYACITDHTSGSPKDYPARWKLVSAQSWAGLSGKPDAMAVGADAAAARAAIGAVAIDDVQSLAFGAVYDTDTVALLSRMSVLPDATRRNAINTLILALKTNNLWTRLDGLYLFAAHSQQAALLNWRRNAANMVATNSPTFTADRGFTGDGAAAFLTNVNAATVNTQPTDVAVSLWLRSKKTVGSWDLSWSGWEQRISTGAVTVGWRSSEGTGHTASISDANQPGLYTISRAAAGASKMYKDGSLVDSTANAYNAAGTYTSTLPIYIGVTSGTSGYTNGSYSACAYGGSMSDAEAALFYNAINTYMAAVGAV